MHSIVGAYARVCGYCGRVFHLGTCCDIVVAMTQKRIVVAPHVQANTAEYHMIGHTIDNFIIDSRLS